MDNQNKSLKRKNEDKTVFIFEISPTDNTVLNSSFYLEVLKLAKYFGDKEYIFHLIGKNKKRKSKKYNKQPICFENKNEAMEAIKDINREIFSCSDIKVTPKNYF